MQHSSVKRFEFPAYLLAEITPRGALAENSMNPLGWGVSREISRYLVRILAIHSGDRSSTATTGHQQRVSVGDWTVNGLQYSKQHIRNLLRLATFSWHSFHRHNASKQLRLESTTTTTYSCILQQRNSSERCSLTGAFAVQFSLTKTKTINAPGVRKIAAPSLKALPFLTLTITLSVEAIKYCRS